MFQTELGARAQAYVDGRMDELIALIEALCRIPAPSHQEDQRAEFIQKWLREAGAKGVYIDEAKNVIYPVDEAGKDALSIFMAHTDTVFPDLTPFEPRTENGRMYCPGVGDDTANVAVLMMIARYAAQNGLKSPSGLVIAFNSCEEGLGNLKGCRALMERFKGRVGKVVSFDSGYDCVIARAVGSARYRVEVRTEGGHSFANFGSRNAIRYLSLLIDMLYAIKPPEKPGAHTTYNVGMIQGGTSVNTIAQQAEMLYEYRSDDMESMAAMEKAFTAAVQAVRAMGVEVAVEKIGERPCMGHPDPAAQQALVRECQDIIQRHSGLRPGLGAGSTDCNIPLSLDIPAACFGVYRGQGAHTREEWIELASLEAGFKSALRMVLNQVEGEQAEFSNS